LQCPDDNALTQWLRRALPEATQRALSAHVSTCAACSALIEDLGQTFAEDAPAQTIGRYVVLRPIGSGGFGVVYLAWDPQLDRQIALKLLRPRDGDATQLAGDLLREAKAMAKLSHPNVTSVYDVAALDGQVAIAMELIDGTDAREWLAAKPRTQEEIVAVFLAAAAGLSAAHAVGLVHRDFKPANVLVGRDGRVAVTDFGLARAEQTAAARSGTPAYMAPEQQRGRQVDARADQYSFAVSLWEALTGERPGPGTKTPPRALKRALERALSQEPGQRFAGMNALIAALAPAKRSRWLGASVAVAIALTPIVAAWAWSRSRDALCSGAPARVEAIWPLAARAQLDTAVAHTMTDWLARWAARSTEACEATRIRGEQPDDVLAARMSCFDRLHDQARAVVDALLHADPAGRAQALQLASSLDPPERCLDAGPLLREEPPPPLHRGDVRQLRFELEQARAQRNLGRFDEAARLSARVESAATELAYPPLLAEAHLFSGELRAMRGEPKPAEELLLQAVHDSGKGRSDRVAADAWIALLQIDGIGKGPDVGRPWREAAMAAAARVRGDDVIQGRLDSALGLSFASEGELPRALALQREALAAMARAYGSDAPQLGPQRHKIAELRLDLGQYVSAANEAQKSLDAIKAAFGPDHPLTALPRTVLAESACERGKPDECLAQIEQAIAVRGAARTPATISRHLIAAVALGELGRPEWRQHLDEAETLARELDDRAWLGRVLAGRRALLDTAEAVRLLTGSVGANDPATWRARQAWALLLLLGGHREEALAELEALQQSIESRFGDETVLLARVLIAQARALKALGRDAEAEPLLQRAAALAADEDPVAAAAAASLTGPPSSPAPRPSP
jgi:serine/threonine protein kinase